jgi:nucleotide-binding universal stress UspA family protein
MQILVPLDGSRFSEQALTSAYKIAQLSKAIVHLVRVIRPAVPVSAEVGFVSNPAIREIKEEAREYLAEHAARAPLGVATRIAVLHGPATIAQTVADYIARADIRMAVMTTHGRTGFGRMWVGSVADELVRIVKIPVLLLRPHKSEAGLELECWHARHILVPLDGSERAEEALEAAVELGWLTGARYTLVQVVRPLVFETYADAVESQLDDHETEHELERSRDYLENVAERLRALGFHVETQAVVHVNIAQGILQEVIASDADMIALATHGRSGWKRLALGSVAQEMLHRSHLPLLLLRTVDAAVGADSWSEVSAAC